MRHSARIYVERGHTVALSARSAEKLQALASDLGPQATAVPVDVTDRTAMQAAAAQIEEAGGPIEMVILGAAFWRQVQPLEFDAELIKGHFDVNVMGIVHGIEAVLPSMRRRRSGTIVGLASVAGYRGLPKSEGYSATKAALINMLESLRIDLRPCGISVITVCPGFVRTRADVEKHVPDAVHARARRCRPADRPGDRQGQGRGRVPPADRAGDEGGAADPARAVRVGAVHVRPPIGVRLSTDRPQR